MEATFDFRGFDDRYLATDPFTGHPMEFEPYVPKHHLMQRLADTLMQETSDGVFYRSGDGSLGYVPHTSPPLQASDERRAVAPPSSGKLMSEKQQQLNAQSNE